MSEAEEFDAQLAERGDDRPGLDDLEVDEVTGVVADAAQQPVRIEHRVEDAAQLGALALRQFAAAHQLVHVAQPADDAGELAR